MAPKLRQQKADKVVDMDQEELQLLITTAVAAATKPISEALSKLSDEVKNLKREIESKDGKILELEFKVDELEQYGRRNNLRIFGVDEKDSEVTDNIVIEVAKKMNIQLDASHIDRSHRLGRKGPKPRPIIVKFTSYAYRNKMFRAKKMLRGTAITVREDLTQPRLALLKEVVGHYGFRSVWTADGVVMVNVGGRAPQRLRDHDELKDLLEKHPPSV